MFTGTVSAEREVKVPASEAWKLYGTLEYTKVGPQLIPGVVSKIDVLQGDGGTGTIFQVHLVPAPGTEVSYSFKEKYTLVDDEKRVREGEVLEGGFLDMGMTLYRATYQVIEKEGVPDECITKATLVYEAPNEAVAKLALDSIQTMSTIMERAGDYLVQNYKKN